MKCWCQLYLNFNFFGLKSYFGPSSLFKVLFWTLKCLANFPARYIAALTTTKTLNPRFFDLLSSMTASILQKNDWKAIEKLHSHRKIYTIVENDIFGHLLLRRSKTLGLGVFVVVGAAVYLAEKFAGDLRDQNRTLSKLIEGPK